MLNKWTDFIDRSNEHQLEKQEIDCQRFFFKSYISRNNQSAIVKFYFLFLIYFFFFFFTPFIFFSKCELLNLASFF